MIAQVIIDIAAKQTDRIFEYHIPKELPDVKVGSRVVIPFGPRKLQGFVVGISERSNFSGKLRDLLLVVDEMPPLTNELVKLSAELAKEVFSYRITILKAMLPRVMRANYRKILTPITEKAKKMPYFQGDPIDLNEVDDIDNIAFIHKLLKAQDAKIEYIVENKAKTKTENQYMLTKSKKDYLTIYNSLRENATKQKNLLMDIIQNFDFYPKMQKQLEKDAEINTATLTSAVNKNWLKKSV